MGKAKLEVLKNYYSTTSSLSAIAQKGHYERAAPGLRRRMGSWMPQPWMKVLDLGCGLGELLWLCERSGCRDLVGVNLCAEEVQLAREFVNADFYCQDILTYLRNTEQIFDCITALNVLEHFGKDEVLEIMKLSSQKLAPGGVFVAIVPNAISPFGNLTRYWDYTHEWAFTLNNFRQLAALSGFDTSIEARECAPVPYALISTFRWCLWKLIRLGIKAYLLVEVADTKGGVYTMDMMIRMHKGSSFVNGEDCDKRQPG